MSRLGYTLGGDTHQLRLLAYVCYSNKPMLRIGFKGEKLGTYFVQEVSMRLTTKAQMLVHPQQVVTKGMKIWVPSQINKLSSNKIEQVPI